MTPITGITEPELRHIVGDLSMQNDAERIALDLSKETLNEYLLALSHRKGGFAEVALHKDKVVAAFGYNASHDVKFHDTWFVARDAFFELGAEGIRYSRQRMRIFRSKGGKPLRSTSYSPLPEAAKWFKILGFVEDTEPRVDGAKVFIYN